MHLFLFYSIWNQETNNPNQETIQLYNELELKLSKPKCRALYNAKYIILNKYCSDCYNKLVCLSAVFELLRHIIINNEDLESVYKYVNQFLYHFKSINDNFLVYFARFTFQLLSIINPHFLPITCGFCQSNETEIMAIDGFNRFICEQCLQENILNTDYQHLDSTLKLILYHQDSFWKMIHLIQESELFISQYKTVLNNQFNVHFNKEINLKSLKLYSHEYNL